MSFNIASLLLRLNLLDIWSACSVSLYISTFPPIFSICLSCLSFSFSVNNTFILTMFYCLTFPLNLNLSVSFSEFLSIIFKCVFPCTTVSSSLSPVALTPVVTSVMQSVAILQCFYIIPVVQALEALEYFFSL